MHEFIGLDVGGTKVASAVLRDGKLGETTTEPTELESQDALVEQLTRAIERLRTANTLAVGIGVPSVVEFKTGRIRASVNIQLANLPLRSLLGEKTGLAVFVDNDATCAAFAEAYEDGKLTCSDLVMFTVGTGVGGGIVLNGHPYRGATGAAAEFGHQIISVDVKDGAPKAAETFPQPGSLEEWASGRALDRLGEALAESGESKALAAQLKSAGKVTGVDVVKAAHDGDDHARRAVEILGERLGIGIANAINIFDPKEVVIGGGASTAGDLLLKPAAKVARQFTLPGVGTETTIRLARHGVSAGVMGAASVAADSWKREK